jgi:hypothetical protein
VLLYSPKTLSEALAGEEAQELLKALGYERPHAADACLEELSRRFKSDSFPHEIGLFLGYPAEDVRGFVEKRQDCHRIPGARWKVYGDPARSLFIMEAHRKAEANAMEAARKVDFT